MRSGALKRAFRGIGLCALAVVAATPAAAAPSDPSTNPLAPPDTSSPRATLRTFLYESRETWRVFLAGSQSRRQTYEDASGHLARASRCLDLSELPPGALRDLADEAVLLIDVLERIPLPRWSQVPDAAAVAREPIDRWRIPGTEIMIGLVTDGPRRGEWLFTTATVKRAREFYERTKHLPAGPDATLPDAYETLRTLPGWWIPLSWIESLPNWARRITFGQTIWQWLALLLAAGLAIGLLFAVRAISRRGAPRSPTRAELRGALASIVAVLLLLWLRDAVPEQLGISGLVLVGTRLVTTAGASLAGAWAAVLVGRALAEAIASSPRIHPKSVDAHLLRISAHVIGIAAGVLIVIQGASAIGVPVLGLVAGLGVGGLAVALAAQSTLENFIGSITIFADRPVRVGDTCHFGDAIGTVEQIGLRSTRIRTLGRSIVTIPNAEFSRMQLDNYSRRDSNLLRTTLPLRYETTPEQLHQVLELLRKLLGADPRVADDPLRVQLVELGPDAYEVEVFAHVLTADWAEFLAIRSELYLAMIEAVAEAGTRLAAPGRTLYAGDASGSVDAQSLLEAQSKAR